MKQNRFFQISLSRSEISWGIRYFLFQMLFLPSLLNSLQWVLPFYMSQARLNFLYFLVNFAATAILFRRFLRQQLKCSWKDFLITAGWAVGFFVLYRLSLHILGWLLFQIAPGMRNQNDQAIFSMSQRSYSLMFVGTVFLAPIAEELLHRALVFRGLYEKSPVLAFAVSTALFSAMHLIGNVSGLSFSQILLSFLQYVPAGLCLAGAYRVSGSIFCPIAVHIAVNAVGMLSVR